MMRVIVLLLLLFGLVAAPEPRDPPPAKAAQSMTHLGIPQEMQTKIFHRSRAAHDKYFSARPAALLRRAAATRATKEEEEGVAKGVAQRWVAGHRSRSQALQAMSRNGHLPAPVRPEFLPLISAGGVPVVQPKQAFQDRTKQADYCWRYGFAQMLGVPQGLLDGMFTRISRAVNGEPELKAPPGKWVLRAVMMSVASTTGTGTFRLLAELQQFVQQNFHVPLATTSEADQQLKIAILSTTPAEREPGKPLTAVLRAKSGKSGNLVPKQADLLAMLPPGTAMITVKQGASHVLDQLRSLGQRFLNPATCVLRDGPFDRISLGATWYNAQGTAVQPEGHVGVLLYYRGEHGSGGGGGPRGGTTAMATAAAARRVHGPPAGLPADLLPGLYYADGNGSDNDRQMISLDADQLVTSAMDLENLAIMVIWVSKWHGNHITLAPDGTLL